MSISPGTWARWWERTAEGLLTVPLSDRRGARRPPEGTQREDQVPAGAAGAGDRDVRHGELAHGLWELGDIRVPQGGL